MTLNDYSKAQINNQLYGGAAGQKLGININGENLFLKFFKSTRSMKNVNISYTTSPLSEYIGSHIYEDIGIDVHATELGIYDNKLVVACRDFKRIMSYYLILMLLKINILKICMKHHLFLVDNLLKNLQKYLKIIKYLRKYQN